MFSVVSEKDSEVNMSLILAVTALGLPWTALLYVAGKDLCAKAHNGYRVSDVCREIRDLHYTTTWRVIYEEG